MLTRVYDYIKLLRKATEFPGLDASLGYCKVGIDELNKRRAFLSCYGLYQFVRTPLGLEIPRYIAKSIGVVVSSVKRQPATRSWTISSCS